MNFINSTAEKFAVFCSLNPNILRVGNEGNPHFFIDVGCLMA